MDHWSRRQFVQGVGLAGLGLLAGCGRLPGQAQAPTAGKIYRLGFLNGTNPAATAQILVIFRQALSELGYAEGQNLIIEYRWAEGNEARLAEPAVELARLPVDAFVVPSAGLARIAREASTTVPIILAGAGDLVAPGLAASYARPGGNITGVINLSQQLDGKRLQLLKEAVPSISRVAVFWNAAGNGPYAADTWGRHAQAVGVELQPMELREPEEFAPAFETAVREGADALIIAPNPLAAAHRARIIELAARLHWSAMYQQRQFVDQGGLVAYDASLTDRWRRAAAYVDKILKGATPAGLPVEQPTTFDFVINLKTAQALGLTSPPHVLLQATEVIQ